MGKRAFFRDRGELKDTYEESPGAKRVLLLPGSTVGEHPNGEMRVDILREVRTAHGGYGLRDDRSQDHLEALLEGLRNGNISAPMSLTHFIDDPRVQPALIAAARRASGTSLANFAQVVGMVGGPGARELLRERLAELTADANTWSDHDFFNAWAGSLCTVARAILELEPDAREAVDVFERLFSHPCGFNRRSAYREAASLLADHRAKTPAFRRLEDLVNRAADTHEDELFVHICPALRDRDKVLSRLAALLRHSDVSIRQYTISRLFTLPHDPHGTLTLLLEAFPAEQSLRLRLVIAGIVRSFLPQDALGATIEAALADESPSLRWDAIRALDLLDSPRRRDVAARALTDEPDPALRQLLERSCS